MKLEIFDRLFKILLLLFKKADPRVTTSAQKTANCSGFMAVINREPSGEISIMSFANSASTFLSCKHFLINWRMNAIAGSQKALSHKRGKSINTEPFLFSHIKALLSFRIGRIGAPVLRCLFAEAFFASAFAPIRIINGAIKLISRLCFFASNAFFRQKTVFKPILIVLYRSLPGSLSIFGICAGFACISITVAFVRVFAKFRDILRFVANTTRLFHALFNTTIKLVYVSHLVFLLGACSQVPISDEIFYGNKGMTGAVEFHTFTTEQKDISFEDWMTLLRTEPLICSSVSTFGDYKKAIEQLCSVCNCCSADVSAKAEEFFNNIQNAEAAK